MKFAIHRQRRRNGLIQILVGLFREESHGHTPCAPDTFGASANWLCVRMPMRLTASCM